MGASKLLYSRGKFRKLSSISVKNFPGFCRGGKTALVSNRAHNGDVPERAKSNVITFRWYREHFDFMSEV